MTPTAEQLRELQDWIRSRPAVLHPLMTEWPPGCVVRTIPSVVLLIPAPGVEGEVQSYFEDGTLGVTAPITIPHPVLGWGPEGRAANEGRLATAPVDPDLLELVREGIATSDMVRAALRGELA